MPDLSEVVKAFQEELVNKNILPAYLVGRIGKINISLLHYVASDHEMTLGFVRQIGLLKTNTTCDTCGNDMVLYEESNTDGEVWRCRKIRQALEGEERTTISCDKKKSIREGSWFEGSKLSIGEIMILTYSLVKKKQLIDIQNEWGHSDETLSDWSNFCRDIYLSWVTRTSKKVGGVGKVVEIDVSKFGKRKYNRGHKVESQWVFGGIERGTGGCFLVPVEDRSSKTLLEVIKKWILPGTTIISDCWRAYDSLGHEGYEHLKVNHSINFVDQTTGAHTNTIGVTWRHLKASLPTSGGVKHHIAGYLAEYIFRKRAKADDVDIFQTFIEEVCLIHVM